MSIQEKSGVSRRRILISASAGVAAMTASSLAIAASEKGPASGSESYDRLYDLTGKRVLV